MHDAESPGVQCEAVVIKSLLVSLTIFGVIDNRVTDGRHVDTDLVGSTRVELETDDRSWRALEPSEHSVSRSSISTIRPDCHLRWRASRSRDRSVDNPLLFFDVTLDEPDIEPAGRVGRHLLGE